jgi:hypothetical protein
MKVRYRPIQRKDVPTCVEHLAAHPVLGPRYGTTIEQLSPAIRHLIGRDSFNGVVFEQVQDSAVKFLGMGMAVFVSENFLCEIKATPFFWAGPELVKRITGGSSPVLADAEVRSGNSTNGLSLLIWHNTVYPRDHLTPEFGTAAMTSFEECYRGYQVREFIQQADCLEHLQAMDYAGGLYFDRVRGSYGNYPEVNAESFSDEPRIVGITRDLALTRVTSWTASFCLYKPPQLGLNRGQQRLLLAALSGATDAELSDTLVISLSAVKKTWRMIYDRVSARLPELVPDRSQLDEQVQSRGKQKKQRLLAYLRDHWEELRPVLPRRTTS